MEDFFGYENVPLRNDDSDATVPRKLVDFESKVSAAE